MKTECVTSASSTSNQDCQPLSSDTSKNSIEQQKDVTLPSSSHLNEINEEEIREKPLIKKRKAVCNKSSGVGSSGVTCHSKNAASSVCSDNLTANTSLQKCAVKPKRSKLPAKKAPFEKGFRNTSGEQSSCTVSLENTSNLQDLCIASSSITPSSEAKVELGNIGTNICTDNSNNLEYFASLCVSFENYKAKRNKSSGEQSKLFVPSIGHSDCSEAASKDRDLCTSTLYSSDSSVLRVSNQGTSGKLQMDSERSVPVKKRRTRNVQEPAINQQSSSFSAGQTHSQTQNGMSRTPKGEVQQFTELVSELQVLVPGSQQIYQGQVSQGTRVNNYNVNNSEISTTSQMARATSRQPYVPQLPVQMDLSRQYGMHVSPSGTEIGQGSAIGQLLLQSQQQHHATTLQQQQHYSPAIQQQLPNTGMEWQQYSSLTTQQQHQNSSAQQYSQTKGTTQLNSSSSWQQQQWQQQQQQKLWELHQQQPSQNKSAVARQQQVISQPEPATDLQPQYRSLWTGVTGQTLQDPTSSPGVQPLQQNSCLYKQLTMGSTQPVILLYNFLQNVLQVN